MNNSTALVNYGSDFLFFNNEVYFSHQFTLEYIQSLIFVFCMGVALGLGFAILYSDFKECLVPWLISKLKSISDK